jgi:hypothetical protein
MKIKALMAAGCALAGLAGAAPASAATNFFTNFDSLSIDTGSWTVVQSIEGWTTTAGAGIEVQNHAAGSPYSEPNLVELDSYNNSTMSRMIDAGKYVLTLKGSGRPGVPSSSSVLEVLINGSVISSGALDGSNLTDTSWVDGYVAFTIGTASLLSLRAAGTDDSYGIYIDDVRLAGTGVPEPAAWALMLAGFGLVGSAMRRRGLHTVTA